MSEKPQHGNATPTFTAQDLDDSLNALFTEDIDVETKEGVAEVATAFVNLTMMYLAKHNWWHPLTPIIQFDYPRLESMIRRFHRDAFGVEKFCKFLSKLQIEDRIDEEDANEIKLQVKRLGLRIISDEPRKTKIVASFALWFSTLKPIYFHDRRKVVMKSETINEFCAYFNLWVTQAFLKKFGKLEWGENTDDAKKRQTRFFHDFTYRAINMSSFEFFYGGIFRVTPEEETKTETVVNTHSVAAPAK